MVLRRKVHFEGRAVVVTWIGDKVVLNLRGGEGAVVGRLEAVLRVARLGVLAMDARVEVGRGLADGERAERGVAAEDGHLPLAEARAQVGAERHQLDDRDED